MGSPWSGGGSPCWGGLPGPGGVLPDRGVLQRHPPPVNRITDTCKNITLATTSLRPVNIFGLDIIDVRAEEEIVGIKKNMFIYSQEVIQASLKPWYESILSFAFWPESLSEFHGAVRIGILKFNGEH